MIFQNMYAIGFNDPDWNARFINSSNLVHHGQTFSWPMIGQLVTSNESENFINADPQNPLISDTLGPTPHMPCISKKQKRLPGTEANNKDLFAMVPQTTWVE